MSLTKTKALRLISTILFIGTMGAAVWWLLPSNPQSGSAFVSASLKGARGGELLAAEANRLTAQANGIAYRQGVAAAVGAVTGIITLVSAVAAALYARAAAAESRRSADIAQAALVASERAWISVDVTPEGPLQYYPTGGISLEIGVHIKNIGKTPALNVHTSVADISLGLSLYPEHLRSFAADERVENTTSRLLLLPAQEYVWRWVPTSIPKKDEVLLYPIITGVVTYQVSLDHSMHQTSFCVILTRRDENENLLIEPGGQIPLEELTFIRWAGAFAD